MLIYWKDKNESLYWEKIENSEFPRMCEQDPQALINFTNKNFESELIDKVNKGYFSYYPKEWKDETIHYYFLLLVEDGGTLKDLDFLKTYINFPRIRKVFINSARILYNWNPYKIYDEEQIAYLRKAIQTYAKVAENPIFQEVLDKYGWNE